MKPDLGTPQGGSPQQSEELCSIRRFAKTEGLREDSLSKRRQREEKEENVEEKKMEKKKEERPKSIKKVSKKK